MKNNKHESFNKTWFKDNQNENICLMFFFLSFFNLNFEFNCLFTFPFNLLKFLLLFSVAIFLVSLFFLLLFYCHTRKPHFTLIWSFLPMNFDIIGFIYGPLLRKDIFFLSFY